MTNNILLRSTSNSDTNSTITTKGMLETSASPLRVYDIVIRMEEKFYTEEICEWAVGKFATIVTAAVMNEETNTIADFLGFGGCEALLLILNRYGESSSIIAANGCETIAALAAVRLEIRDFLGNSGACEAVIFLMKVHMGNAEVLEHGSKAIGSLARMNSSNIARFSDIETFEILTQAGNFGFNLRHTRCVAIAKNVCDAFIELAENVENSQRFVDCSAPELVWHLVKLHYRDAKFAQSGLQVLSTFLGLNCYPEHKEECDQNNNSNQQQQQADEKSVSLMIQEIASLHNDRH